MYTRLRTHSPLRFLSQTVIARIRAAVQLTHICTYIHICTCTRTLPLSRALSQTGTAHIQSRHTTYAYMYIQTYMHTHTPSHSCSLPLSDWDRTLSSRHTTQHSCPSNWVTRRKVIISSPRRSSATQNTPIPKSFCSSCAPSLSDIST